MKNQFFIMSMLISLLAIVGCRDPFFPENGFPPEEPLITLTPEELLTQLQRAYEQRSLSLFRKLIFEAGKDFDYYIEANQQTFNNLSFEKEETDTLEIVAGSNHKYIAVSYTDELQIHSNLFRQSEEIYFLSPLIPIYTYYETDTAFVDSASGITTIDTLYAVVSAGETKIRITAPDVIQGGTEEYPISGQIFCLKRDAEKNWKIWKWFELN